MNSFSHKWKKQCGVFTSERVSHKESWKGYPPSQGSYNIRAAKAEGATCLFSAGRQESWWWMVSVAGFLWVYKDSLWSSSPGCIAVGYHQKGAVPHKNLLKKKSMKILKCWLDNSWPAPACNPFISYTVWDEKTGMQSTRGCIVVGACSLPGEFPRSRMTKGNSWGLQSKEMSGRTL